MDIKELYNFNQRLNGFSEYVVPRQQYDTRKSSSKLSTSKSPLAQGNYVTLIQKSAQQTPGPGRYSINPEIPPFTPRKPSKIDFSKLVGKGRATHVDDLIKLKSKIPEVGQYQLFTENTDQLRKKYRQKGDAEKKKAPLFRPTALDQVNRDTLNVSPAKYDITHALVPKSINGNIYPEHKRSLSLPRLPGSADYRPIPVSYTTFDRKKKYQKPKKSKKNTFGSKGVKLRSQSVGPGPKYNLISQWIQTKDKYGHKKGKNLFRSVSSLKAPGVYH